MYAWSRIAASRNEWGRVEKWIEPGDEVSQSDLDVSDDEWQELQDLGAVREEEYPKVAPGESPAEYFRRNRSKAPETPVDATTPSHEAMGKIEAGRALGEKPPGATEAEKAAADNKTEQQPTTGGNAPAS